uniref:Large ribosomal subunit protein uL22c n=1 Tax=Membranoptera platyphylla TaxID=1204437 RepID=A0A1I9KQM4_9FLOR|nr:ribosomal protein L22 [Membranoptera platyphylla]AMJ16926.1 ribosomal protein L22 [Membranoptera platyphylla]
MNIDKKQYKSIGKYLRLSTHKVRRILEQIKGKNYKEASLMLEFMPYKACKSINKILQSALSNIKNNNDKLDINTNNIIISKAFANKGPTLKRVQPRAQGRAFPIHKPTCHITIELKEII